MYSSNCNKIFLRKHLKWREIQFSLAVPPIQVFQVQREALFNKSERQVAESQLATVQQQLAELKAQSGHIQELHKDIQESQDLVKEKDRKVGIQ